MAGQFPTTPKPTGVDIELNSPTLVSTSVSGIMRRVSMAIQFYTMKLNYSNLTQELFRPIQGFIAKQYGSYDSFTIILPEISYRSATGTTSYIKVLSGVSAGSTTFTCNTTAAEGATVLKAGDFIKFNDHYKVYMVTDDVVIDSDAQGQVNITPALVDDTSTDEVITYDAVPFTVMLTNEVQSFSVGIGGISNFSIDLRETRPAA